MMQPLVGSALDDLNNKQPGLAANRMLDWTPEQTVLFYLQNPQHQGQLRQADCAGLWSAIFDKLFVKQSSPFRFQHQTSLNDIDFVIGYVCYLYALSDKEKGNTDDYANYLKQAMMHSSIHAHQTCFQEVMMADEKNPSDITNLLLSWRSFAAQHGTPGYLLLANGYLQLALLYAQSEDKELYDRAVQMTWTYLLHAEYAEKDSSASIHNAYFGQGLALSNPFKMTSIGEMKHSIGEQFMGNLSEDIKTSIEKEVKRQIQQAIKKTPASWSLNTKYSEEGQNDSASNFVLT